MTHVAWRSQPLQGQQQRPHLYLDKVQVFTKKREGKVWNLGSARPEDNGAQETPTPRVFLHGTSGHVGLGHRDEPVSASPPGTEGFLPPSAHACRRCGQTRSLWAGFPGRRSLPACTDGALSSSPLLHAVCRARVTTRTQVTMGMTQIKCKCHGELRHPFIDHSL